MSEHYQGDYSPEMFNEAKRYHLLQAQERGNLTDAELRDLHNISGVNLRRFIQSQLGDCAVGNGFKIAQTTVPSNNFNVTGGDGSLDGPGEYYLDGYRLFLKGTIAYSDQTSTGNLSDDAYTKSTIPPLTVPTGIGTALNAIALDGSTIVACGDYGSTENSFDSGRTWTDHTAGSVYFQDVALGDSSTGFAVGPGNAIMKTTNGGNSWAPSAGLPSLTTDLSGVSFFNQNLGWVCGRLGYVFQTSDSGISWTQQAIGITAETLGDVDLADSSNVWAVGTNGAVIHTSDGVNWASQLSGSTRKLNKVFAINTSYVFIAGDLGTILRTSNSGTSWGTLSSGTTRDLYGLYFKDNVTGWVVGANGTLLDTSDSGTTWRATTIEAGIDLHDVVFTDTTGFIVGTNGRVYRTLNGTSWDQYRTDYAYIDFHLGEVSGDATSGSEYYDSTLFDSVVGLPNANRLRIVQDVRVSEGWPTPPDYIGPDGTVQHLTSTLAKILRAPTTTVISNAIITDLRNVVRTVSELDSALKAGGIDSSAIADGAVTPSKVVPSADYTFGSIDILRDASIGGNMYVDGTLIAADFQINSSVGNLTVRGSSTLGDGLGDDTVGINGRIVQNSLYNYPAYDLYVGPAANSPVFNIESDGSGNVFHIERNSDASVCLFDMTNLGKGYDFCLSHLGYEGGVFKIRDDASNDSFVITKNAPGFVGSVFNVTSTGTSPILNIFNRASSPSTSISIDQTAGTIIRLNTGANASGVCITSSGSGTDLKVVHGGSAGYAIDVTSSGLGALNITNLKNQAINIKQLDNATLMSLDKDGTGAGRALEINNYGSDVGFGVYNNGSGMGQLISHVGDSTNPALDIFVAGTESGPALRINKSNDETGEVVKLWNQGFSESILVSHDRTDSSAAAFRLDNRSMGMDFSSNGWWIDNTGNILTWGSVTAERAIFDSTGHGIDASSLWFDRTNFDSSNSGISGRVYQDSRYLKISDGTSPSPDFLRPALSEDSSSPNNSLYFSITQGKLVYKGSDGTVHDLY